MRGNLWQKNVSFSFCCHQAIDCRWSSSKRVNSYPWFTSFVQHTRESDMDLHIVCFTEQGSRKRWQMAIADTFKGRVVILGPKIKPIR